MDYNIEELPNGDWRVEDEAFKKGLYKAGDVFIVDNNGWLRKVSDTEKFAVFKQEVNN